MILLVGDSNLRNVVEENQKAISTKLNDEIVFEQAGTNESLKTILEASATEYNQVVIATLLNEITKLGKAVKTRDDIINTVTKQQAEIVAKPQHQVHRLTPLHEVRATLAPRQT